MWKYIKKYIPFLILAGLSMILEVYVDLKQPDIMVHIVDDGVLGLNTGGVGSMDIILRNGLMMIGLVVAGGLGGAMCSFFATYACENIGNGLRKDCFRKVMSFSFPQMDSFGTGALITRITNDVVQVQAMVMQMVRSAIRTSFMFFGSLFFMYRLYPQFALIVICALPFMLGCMLLCLSKANPHFLEVQSQLDKINSIMQEDISGIRIIKACVREVHERLRFGRANDDLMGTQLHVLVIFALMSPVMNAIMYVVVVIILFVGSYQSQGGATPGAVMGAITYTTQILQSVLGLVMLFQNISRGLASWKRVREILRTEPQMKDGSFADVSNEKGRIEFKDVSFAYPGTDKNILENINLSIVPGETVAIMGATGCGKTSLINLIPRFYDVTAGQVLVDGVDVRDYNQQHLRSKVAVALQNAELFSVSIADNIAWGDIDAAQEDIAAAAKIAQAAQFIEATAEGFDTVVAERGMSLSGGQRQRVSVARAVLKRANILIFDDSTSALDLKTEAALYDALEQRYKVCTKIIVAQRIASVRRADRIVVLEDGHIAACGSHEELMANCSIYQDIYSSQLGSEVTELV